jgi:thiamine-monophosphate kinase
VSGEEELLDWLGRLQPGTGLGFPGDDAAVLGRGAAARALTVDQQIAGIHVPEDLDPAVWARRLLAVNLSDLAAIGGRPQAALLTLAVPPGFPIRRFLRAAVDACRRAGVRLIGGDIARSTQAVTTMTLVGDRPTGGRWVTRSGAKPGDRLWLGGTVGLSAIGRRLVARGGRLAGNRIRLPDELELRPGLMPVARRALRSHLAPKPQLRLGRWLGTRRRAAAIDISDGLAKDLHRLCRASGVGAVIERRLLPLRGELTELAAALDESATDLALAGGEDYSLLFALPPRTTLPASLDGCPLGRITAGRRIWIADEEDREELAPTGWDHLR